ERDRERAVQAECPAKLGDLRLRRLLDPVESRGCHLLCLLWASTCGYCAALRRGWRDRGPDAPVEVPGVTPWVLRDGQCAAELPPGADVQLLEDVAQVPLDGAGAEEQLRPDLGIRVSVARKLGDLSFLGSQVAESVCRTFAYLLSGREQL